MEQQCEPRDEEIEEEGVQNFSWMSATFFLTLTAVPTNFAAGEANTIVRSPR